jgi:hypothetical protein
MTTVAVLPEPTKARSGGGEKKEAGKKYTTYVTGKEW